ncbi:MAG: hypothetical protein P8J33_15610 [Pirellulaceae bacterium]|nr:hypothetical protein [Pirellulaceae bacterium]
MSSVTTKISTIAIVIAASFAFSLQASAQQAIDDRADALFAASFASIQDAGAEIESDIAQLGTTYANAVSVAAQLGDRAAATKLSRQFSIAVKNLVGAGIAGINLETKQTQDKLGSLLKQATDPSTVVKIEQYIGFLEVAKRDIEADIFNAENAARTLVSNAANSN